jgi:Cohesin domain
MFQRRINNIIRFARVCALAAVTLISARISTAQAAVLFVTPASIQAGAGDVVSATIRVSANGSAINTAGATIHFPPDLLTAESVDTSSSIFSLWVEQPTISNSAGTVTFMGGVPNPGYSGQNGAIATILFKARSQGSAPITLSDASVLANDGQGTDVLTAYGNAAVTVGSPSIVSPVALASNGLPPRPIVTSPTDPDQQAWYSATTASFSWTVPPGVTSIETLLSKDPSAVPTIVYDNTVSGRTVSDIGDGVRYFAIRYENSSGWGPIARYKIQIDSTPPEKFAPAVATDGVTNTIALDAVDSGSGIDSYSIKIDAEPALRVSADALVNGQYALPIQNGGDHRIAVVAYDKAGNATEEDASFSSPDIVPPTIAIAPAGGDVVNCEVATVACSAAVSRSNTITIKGATQYPNTPIDIYIQAEGQTARTYTTTTLADGSYSFVTDPLTSAGIVSVWSQLAFADGAMSAPSEKALVHVADTLLVQTSKSLIYGLSYAIPALILLSALLYLLYLGWHKYLSEKKRLEREARESIADAHKALRLFKEELANQLDTLKKARLDRDLNRREEKIFKELQDNIDAIDDFIEKKIKRIK